ncbi:hypothetical protein ACKVWC_006181 [Pyricularia oryzae]
MLRIRPRILITTAVQAAFLKAAANITVQVATAWKLGDMGHKGMDWGRVAEFTCYGFISASLGFPWQHLLEHHFPTQTTTAGNPSLASRAVAPAASGLTHDGHDPDDPEKSSLTRAAAQEPGSTAATLELPPTPGTGGFSTHTKINWPNVCYKLVLDQTVWLLFTTSIFLVVTNVFRVASMDALYEVWKEKTWYIIKAAWHVWPLVAILNFAFVPVDLRVLVAACVGFAWNIFLSFISLTKPK